MMQLLKFHLSLISIQRQASNYVEESWPKVKENTQLCASEAIGVHTRTFVNTQIQKGKQKANRNSD